jgi:hypothetical protein
MREIKYINSEMVLVVRNSDFDKNEPVYISYDEHWQEIGRCHNFSGENCELIFEEAKEATFAKAATPRRVYVEVHGPVVFDPDFPDVRDPKCLLIPSHRGMWAEPRQPIWLNGIIAYSRVTIPGKYLVRYERKKERLLWVECDECVGYT